MKKIARLGALTLAVLCIFVIAAFSVSAATLTDIQNHWAKEYVEYGVEKGYISGYEDGTFLPNKTVTRAEFSKMINSAISLTATGNAKADFSDVTSKDWFFNEVKKAENAGYIAGYEDGTFRPSNSVTRQEAAVVLSRIVIPTSERANINSFGDGGKIDTWATDAVSMIAAKGYIKGDENGNFSPKGALTRAQAAKLICEFVKNENIVNKNQTLSEAKKEVVYSEMLLTDDVVIDVKEGENVSVVFKNCRVLGNVYVKTADASVKLEGASVKNLYVSADDAKVTLDATSEVKTAYVDAPATLKGNGFKNVVVSCDDLVTLDGDFDKVEVTGDALVVADDIADLAVTKKSNLVLQSGNVDKLTVESTAKGSTINLMNKVVVKKAQNKAAVSYIGSGTVKEAVNEVAGVTFDDGVTVEKTSGKGTEGAGSAVSSKDFFKNVTVSPTNKKTKVSVAANTVFTFSEEVFDKNGDKLTAEYVKNNFEFKRGSADGSSTTFTATVTSGNKKITLNPSSNLRYETKYYVVIPAGTLTYAGGVANEEYTIYFTTASALDDEDEDEDEVGGGSASGKDDEDEDEEEDKNAVVTMDPKSGSEDVPVNSAIKLTFKGVVKSAGVDELDEKYIEREAIKIYEGSTKEENEISFTAAVGTKTINLIPSNLLGDTKYYVVIVGGKLKVDGDTLSKTTMSFTTEAGVPIKVTPESGSTGVSTMPEIKVAFSEPVLQNTKTFATLDAAYIEDEVVLFRKSSATSTKDEYQISYSVEIADNGKSFTIVPDEELEYGVTYYIIIQPETLYGENSGMENEKFTSSFKTASAMAPMFTPMDEETDVDLDTTEIRISFSDDLLTYEKNKADCEPVDDTYLDTLINGYEDSKGKIQGKNRITLKRGTKLLDITATLDADGRTIIITPAEALTAEKTYTISIEKNLFYAIDEDGKYKANTSGKATFDTNEALSPVITPRNDAKSVAVTVNPTVKFAEEIFPVDDTFGDVFVPKYLKESFEFVDENGDEVEFSAYIDGSTITIEPKEELAGNTEYTLTLVAGRITNEDRVKTNEEVIVTFTTKISRTITLDLGTEDDETKNISPNVNPVVKFGSLVFTEDDEEIDEEYLEDKIFMSVTSAASDYDSKYVISATVTPCDDGKSFVIVPDDALEFGKTYYVNVVDDAFNYEDGKASDKFSESFTVIKEPKLTNVKKSSSSNVIKQTYVKIGFTSNVKGTVYAMCDGAQVGVKTLKAAGSSTVEVKDLTPGETYTFTLYVEYEDGITSDEVSVTLTTKAQS